MPNFRTCMAMTFCLWAVESLPIIVPSGPQNLVYSSAGFKDTDAVCENAFQPWTDETERAWHEHLKNTSKKDLVPVVRSELAVAFPDRNSITFRCSDARRIQAISRANIIAGKIVEVRDVNGFSLVCTDFESPETRRVAFGRRARSTRSMGFCRPKTDRELQAIAEIQRRQVESGMTQCIDLNVEPAFESVTAWTSGVSTDVNNNRGSDSWVVASDFRMYELGTALADIESLVHTVQLPVDKRGSRTYRTCAHIGMGKPNAMLHMGAFASHMVG